MKILIVGPGFFGYAEALSKEMRVRGHSVKFIHERGNESFLVKLIFRVGILQKVFWPVVRYFQFMILQTAKQYEPTHVLFVSPDAMSSYLVNGLKTIVPYIGVYMWDSFQNKPSSLPYKNQFDFFATFDPLDAEIHDLRLINLFAEEHFASWRCENSARDLQIVFVGTAHSERAKILWSLQEKLKKMKVKHHIHAYWGNIVYSLSSLFKSRGLSIGMLKRDQLSKNEVAQLFGRSRFVLDIKHPEQTGLTSRSFEALVSGAHLLTNNEKAQELLPNYRDQIHLWDVLDEKFLERMLGSTTSGMEENEVYELSIHRFASEIETLLSSAA